MAVPHLNSSRPGWDLTSTPPASLNPSWWGEVLRVTVIPEHTPANSTGKLQGQAERRLAKAGAQACVEGTGHTGRPSVRRGEGPQPRPCLHAPTALQPDLPRAPDPCPPVNPSQSFPPETGASPTPSPPTQGSASPACPASPTSQICSHQDPQRSPCPTQYTLLASPPGLLPTLGSPFLSLSALPGLPGRPR